MDETEYLLRTRKNKKALKKSIKQVKEGKTVSFELVEEESSASNLDQMRDICADYSVFKKAPLAAVKSGNEQPIAVCKDGNPLFYCVPARLWDDIMELFEDQDLLRITTNNLTKKANK